MIRALNGQPLVSCLDTRLERTNLSAMHNQSTVIRIDPCIKIAKTLVYQNELFVVLFLPFLQIRNALQDVPTWTCAGLFLSVGRSIERGLSHKHGEGHHANCCGIEEESFHWDLGVL